MQSTSIVGGGGGGGSGGVERVPQQPATKKPQRRFQFIDNNNITSMGSNSTQVRRHVMQEYMREKRWQARSRLQGYLEPESQAGRSPVQSAHTQNHSGQQHAKSKTSSSQSDPATPESGTFPAAHVIGTSSPSSQSASEAVDEIPRYWLEQPTAKERWSTRFNLGPAAFAQLADLLPEQPTPGRPSSLSLSASSSLLSSPSTISSSGEPGLPVRQRRSYQTKMGASPEPQSVLSAARTDPFDCLPMTLTRSDQVLFDFYANVMPACSYGFERRSPHAHNWYLSVFIPEAMKGAVCFQNTILVHAANTQAWVQGLAETRLTIEHRARASQLLLDHYQRFPDDTSDATISATLSAAALEDFDPRLERRKYAWMHWRAAVQKIRDRGGPAALVQHNRLQMLINWSDYIFSGYNAHGATFYFDHESSPEHTNDEEAEIIARNEVAHQCEELITFLKCVEHLAMVQAGMQHNAVARRQQTMRFSVFRPGRPLHNLLASPNGPRYTGTGQYKQIISRLAALMTINTAIWEYRHSPELSEEFFTELTENILYNDLDQHLSVEALIQILLSGSKNPVLLHSERPWFVGRMLKIAKRLSRPSFEKLNDLLRSYLTLGPDLRPTMMEWENELRMEVLQAPLVRYTVPFMDTAT